MKKWMNRCLSLLLVMALVFSCGLTEVLAASIQHEQITMDLSNLLEVDPNGNYALMTDPTENMQSQIAGYEADDVVEFIVELEGASVLEAMPATVNVQDFLISEMGIQTMSKINNEQKQLENTLAAMQGLDITYTYQVVLNGFAVRAAYSQKATLEALPGVRSVTVADTYTYVAPTEGYTAAGQTSGEMIDSDSVNAEGYTGKGTVTAILDTGIDLEHDAFQNAPEGGRLALADIEAYLAAGNLNATATAEELFKSEKVPFAFNYTDYTTDVTDAIGHGTHVAGTVGGDCEDFTGVAPDTQIVFMRVFNAEGGGATTSVLFAALEDCVVLNVDSINMSLGTPGGFTSADELTNAVYNKIMEAGINLMVSAGNETDATTNTNGPDLPLISEPDNAIVGSPSTYPAAMSVASVNEYQQYITYIAAGELRVQYNDANIETALDFIKYFDGQTLDYVVVPGFGTADDFAAVDVEGKIALVVRGELAFTDKEQNAYDAGAIGMIVFDNTEGDRIYMADNDLLPMIFISKADGLALRDAETKTISVSTEYKMFEATADGGLMSSFSSLGVAPDLTLKPEITAPGGYVYSAMPGNTYDTMSGTSMAAPHMAGAASVIRQYVNEAFPDLSNTEKQELINTLLMNTAVPVTDEYGVAVSPRKQGAGLAQVSGAVHTGAYVTVDGNYRPKAELGDSANGYFSKEVTLTIHNISDTALTYNMSAIALTAQEEMVTVNGVQYHCISNYSRVMPEEEFQVLFSVDTVTVPAGGTASVTVKLRLTEAGEASLANFVNGTFLDGFIVLESLDSDIDLSVPYLGFYGDWGQASVFDDSIYDEEEASVYDSSMALLDLNSGGGFYLGYNMYADTLMIDEDKIAVSYSYLSAGYRPFTMLGLLRAPKSLTYSITDAEGNPVELIDEAAGYVSLGYEYTEENVIKSFYYSNGGFVNYSLGPTGYGWCPAQFLDEYTLTWLDDGQYTIHITAQVDGTDSPAGTQSISFPITIDSQAPQLLGTDHEQIDGRDYVTIDLYDNHYIMAFQIISSDGLSVFSPVVPLNEAEAGTTSSFTFETTALLEAGYTTALVMVYDYAFNGYLSYEFSLESDTLQPVSVGINNRIASISGAQTVEIEAYVLPEGLEDTVLTWASSDESIATVTGLEKTRYDDQTGTTFYTAEVTTYNVGGDVTISVTTQNGKTDSFTMRVVADYDELPEDYVIREDGTYVLPADLNTTVTITDNAQNVVIIGNEANTADAPYKDLYLNCQVANLNLTIRNLNVTNTKTGGSWSSTPATSVIAFTGAGNKLTISGENRFIGASGVDPALIAAGGAHYTNNYATTELTIDGDGSLYLETNGYGAAIGGASGQAAGKVVIAGGELEIKATNGGAGIGGGSGGSSGDITVNGGSIHLEVAPASSWSGTGAGIGSGNYAYGSGNTIVINGGIITGHTGGKAALIGAGDGDTSATTVTINGGYLNVGSKNIGYTASSGGAAIGSSGGSWSATGAANITINGGEVIAWTETAAAAIGGGYYGGVPTITVNGGTVSAYAFSSNSSESYRGAAIGKGCYGSAGYVYINAGAVLAVGNAASNMNATVMDSDYNSLVEVTLTLPGVQSLTIDGVDWKVSANHADFTEQGGENYTSEVHVWLPETTDTPYFVIADTQTGEQQFELWTSGLIFPVYTVSYQLNGLLTDGPATVYAPEAGESYSKDLTGKLMLEEGSVLILPETISVTIDGVEIEHSYDPATGEFVVAKELLTGNVVITAEAVPALDKTALIELIAQAEAMDSANYTGESWDALQTALAEAKLALEEAQTQEAVDAAYNALLAAVEQLIARADASELEALIAEAEQKQEDAHTSTTWADLEAALEEARNVAENSNATEQEIADAYAALEAALDALVQRGDKTALRQLIDQADVLFERNYTAESWEESRFDALLAEAIAVYADPDATQEQIDAAAEALRNAMDALVWYCNDNHTLVHHEGQAPTCTEIGWEAYDTCECCDYTTYAEIPATGHAHEAVTTAPTCTEQGYTTYTCHCGDSYVDDYTDAHGHSYVDRVCVHCGEAEPVEMGDANGDGVINHLDAMLIAQYYVGAIGEDAIILSAADVNGDGVINHLDAMMVAQFYVSAIDQFEKPQ